MTYIFSELWHTFYNAVTFFVMEPSGVVISVDATFTKTVFLYYFDEDYPVGHTLVNCKISIWFHSKTIKKKKR